MSKELELKSGTKQTFPKPKMVRMLNDVQFFGVSGPQVTEGMGGGIHLEWNGSVVVVTCDSNPGESKWLFPAGISFISWKE
jgi:hypothetical protein